MAKFKINEIEAKKAGYVRFRDTKTNEIINFNDVIERDGERAKEFQKSPFFIEIKEDDTNSIEELTKDEIKAILDENKVKYKANDNKETLIKLVKENG